MKIDYIIFNNFRCFYGEQTITFSTLEEENVTLVRAQNGSGKTSILNAVLWTFYGTTTGKFEDPNNIIHTQAKKEGKTTAYVQICFEHQNNKYFV